MVDLTKLPQNMWIASQPAVVGGQKAGLGLPDGPNATWPAPKSSTTTPPGTIGLANQPTLGGGNSGGSGGGTGTGTGGGGGMTAQPTSLSQMPSWMPRGTYDLYQVDIPNNLTNIQQSWYRNPAWGGGAIYNPYWGWQNNNTIKSLYRQYGTQGNISDEEMMGWNLTKNMGQDWRQYADTLGYTPTWSELRSSGQLPSGGGGAGGGSGASFGSLADMMRFLVPLPEYSNNGMDGGAWALDGEPAQYGKILDPYSGDIAFQNQPKEWNQASSTLRGFAQTGNPVDIPEQWARATANANQMWNLGGMPTDTSEWYERAKAVAQRDTDDEIKEAIEQAGLTGTRWSTSMGRTSADIAGKNMATLGAEFARQTMEAQEAARQRQLAANEQLYGAGTGYAGLDTDARNRAMSAASGLTGLGQYMTRYPMDISNQMFQQGTVLQNQDQAAYAAQLQEFLRGANEYNPWLSYMMQLGTGQGIPQMYTPGVGSQLLSGLTSALPLAAAFI